MDTQIDLRKLSEVKCHKETIFILFQSYVEDEEAR